VSAHPERLGYQEIAHRIRAEIARGERHPGDRLPTVRIMASTLGVNANTVARAYGELVRDGCIETMPGAGTFVRAGSNDALAAERRAEQLRAIVAEAVLRALSLGHMGDEIIGAVRSQLGRWERSVQHRPNPAAQGNTLRFAGSHDLALELLATRLHHQQSLTQMELTFTGSTGGLLALLTGEADLAGCHLDGGVDAGPDADPIQRLLPGRALSVVTLARRQQGLIVPPGNPGRIERVEDLTRHGLVLALRQAGSGTRRLLEEALAHVSASMDLSQHPVFTTHAAVAAAVAQGTADVGLGILAAARTYGLDFIPLTWEPYDLVIPLEYRQTEGILAALEILRSPSFLAVMSALGGYDTSVTGQERVIQPRI
jgi:molybdate-binding protein/DNA-binding transcriptional regulator YhcF (GntR family)